jgi:prepilin-type processing-associated H-X9-DG protein
MCGILSFCTALGTKRATSERAFAKEPIGTRGKDDVATPLGEWTKVECISRGNKIEIRMNETKVNDTGWHGWLIGTSQTVQAGQPGFSSADSRIFGLTSIRYQINQKSGWLNGGDCVNAGVCPNFGCNVPLNSTHSGGVNAAFCDGTVRFLANNISLLTLAEIATRDDGLPIPSLD